jgi:hypothetical protein
MMIPALDRSADPVYRLLAVDACDASPTRAQSSTCADVADGILGGGVSVAVEWMARQARSVLAAAGLRIRNQPDPDSATFPPVGGVDAADLTTFQTVLQPHLRQALATAASTQFAKTQAAGQLMYDVVISMTWTFLVVFAAFTVYFYWPVTATLSVRIRAAWRLLSVMPPDLVLAVPQLKSELRSLVFAASDHNSPAHHNKKKKPVAGRWCSTCSCAGGKRAQVKDKSSDHASTSSFFAHIETATTDPHTRAAGTAAQADN